MLAIVCVYVLYIYLLYNYNLPFIPFNLVAVHNVKGKMQLSAGLS